jgi:hypothetical protein
MSNIAEPKESRCPPLKDVPDASEELGVCPAWTWRMIRTGKWPAYQLGSKKGIRVDVDEIRALTRRGIVKSA